jgi:hypothetical protein
MKGGNAGNPFIRDWKQRSSVTRYHRNTCYDAYGWLHNTLTPFTKTNESGSLRIAMKN